MQFPESRPAPWFGALRCLWPAQAQLGEGLCWSPASQRLWWVDILGQTLHCCDAQGDARRSWPLPDTISAVAERESAPGLVVTLRRGLALFDPDSGRCEYLSCPEEERPDNRFNDGKCDARGRFWGGSMDFSASAPTGRLWCFEGGSARCAFAADYPVTNGPTWIDGGHTLLFSDTVNRRVLAHAFDPATGTVGPGHLWYELPAEDGHPDGMTTDAAGRVWIAHWGGASVTVHDPRDARELARISLPTRNITNVAFGGPELRTLFITSACVELDAGQRAAEPLAGALFALDTDVVGLPAHRFRD